MTVETLKATAKIALPILLMALAVPAFAEDVSFTTLGSFTCGAVVADNPTETCSVTTTTTANDTLVITNSQNSSLTITAIGQTQTNVQAANPNLDDVNVMVFHDSISKNNNFGTVSIKGATFGMQVTETAPSNLGGAFTGSLAGMLGVSNSDPNAITFANTSLTLGNVTYVLDSNPWRLASPGLAPNFQVSTDTAQVLPEPTFMMLTGLGFAGLAFLAYRRRRTA